MRPSTRSASFAIAGIGFAATLAIVACGQPSVPAPVPVTATATAPAQDPVEYGKYLVDSHGCDDCHTPLKMGAKGVPEPDLSRRLSGHPEAMKMPPPPTFAPNSPWGAAVSVTNTAWAGPWGVSFTANLTSDQLTGLGIWTETMFMQALRTGKHMGQASSRDILPPMPWQAFGKMKDEDLKAIFAFLKTLPAIVNHVPEPVPPAAAK